MDMMSTHLDTYDAKKLIQRAMMVAWIKEEGNYKTGSGYSGGYQEDTIDAVLTLKITYKKNKILWEITIN